MSTGPSNRPADRPVDQVAQRARRRLASRLLGVPASRLSVRDIAGCNATLVSEPVRDGGSIIVADGEDGPEVLYGSPSVAPRTLVDEFIRGRRTPLEQFDQRRAQG